LFTDEIEGINETKLGMPADYYIPNIFVANKGDSITMHFYNLDADDRHTFTIGVPYNINEDLALCTTQLLHLKLEMKESTSFMTHLINQL
jgi:hypothetical protein